MSDRHADTSSAARWAATVAEVGRFDGIVDLTRLTDGRVMCCICFEYTPRGDLWRDDKGGTWDMCRPCGDIEGDPGDLAGKRTR
jgi:hypothetical protein